jgi:predicted phosphodiesterase
VRIALVSDIHGNLPALEAVAAALAAERVDLVLNLGDIASGPLWPRETVQWLARRGWPTIAGNHERQALAATPGRLPLDGDDAFAAAELGPAERAWLAALPAGWRSDDGSIVAFHGCPGDDLRGLLETVTPEFAEGINAGVREATQQEVAARLGGLRAPVLACGHTHRPRISRLAGGGLVVNPGSVGRPAYAHDQPHRHVVETGSPRARWALLELAAAGWQAQLRAEDYDWTASAARAAAAGFEDWAHELATGRTRPGAFGHA